MVAIGEYELAVLKAVGAAGGAADREGRSLEVRSAIAGDTATALEKLLAAEYLEATDDGSLGLTEIGWEYLEMLAEPEE